jgi:uncharacterized phage protein gp47/JayE
VSKKEKDSEYLARMAKEAAKDPHPMWQYLARQWAHEAQVAKKTEQEKGKRR